MYVVKFVWSDYFNSSPVSLLQLQVSGKNLVNVCKLVFKVAQDDKNDPLFLEANILGESYLRAISA